MSNPADPLTNDPIALQAMLAAERAENERLRQIIKELQRHRFGRRAESLPVEQLLLGLEEAEQVEAEGFAREDAADPAKREGGVRKRRANRGALPAHLPRIEQIIDIPDKVCPCCKGMLHVMGEDRSERLDIVPAQFRVVVTRRPKYACRSCEEVVVQAPAPSRLVEGGIPTEATVAHVLVSKYADHLPLYRQSQIYARQGVNLDRSTLADWVGKAAFLLRPVHERLFERLKASDKLFADETTAPVLDPGRGRTKTGQLFAYARDDRPWGGIDPPGVAYLYAPDRKAEQPLRHLQGFVGILQVDGYAGYKALAERNDVGLAFCWSHVRRRFYELAQSGPAPIATEAHDYKRHGTTTLFAALNVLEGTVFGKNMQRHRHQEFIRFLNALEREIPAGKVVHAILDNYAAHKTPEVRRWLERHPRWTFHFTPTSSSWLNAVEGFFAKLSRRRLKHGVFCSVTDLQAAINRFVAEHNENPKPFVWRADPAEIIAARARGFQALESIH